MKGFVLITAVCLSFGDAPFNEMNSSTLVQQDTADSQAAGVDQRGDQAMGFSHESTAHHFLLLTDGGMIKIEAKTESDDATRDQIRIHLAHISAMFSTNDFVIPMFIHGRMPPGAPIMKAKHDAITYKFEPTSRGGQVRITTHDPDAIKAVHDFLKFQIEDHRTGDQTGITQTP
jgi:hypothetical protein